MTYSQNKNAHFFVPVLALASGMVPVVALALAESANPLQSPTLMAIVRLFVNAIVYVVTPVLILAFVYGGFLFISAQGSSTKITTAKSFLFTITWVSMCFWGVWSIIALVVGTISMLTAGGLLFALTIFFLYAISRR